MSVKVVIQRYAHPGLLPGNAQDVGVFGAFQTNFGNMNSVEARLA